MKFRIRFADQIVGISIIVALLSLIFIIFMLGNRQRWFAKDNEYVTYFESANGLSANMNIQFKGFTIGTVRSFRLTDDDRVEVIFTIQDTYTNRVRRGSLVDISVSPIGLGSQFMFFSGLGEVLTSGDFIPAVDSPEGRLFVRSGLAQLPSQDDSISLILGQVNSLVGNIDELVVNIDSALAGNDTTSLGRTFSGIEETITGITVLPATVISAVDMLVGEIEPILADLNLVTEKLSDPTGTVANVLDGEGAIYTSLENSLKSISGVLDNLDRTTMVLPSEMPQLAALLSDVRSAVQNAEDVLVSLTNNPLLRGGMPARVQTQTGGTSPRDIAF